MSMLHQVQEKLGELSFRAERSHKRAHNIRILVGVLLRLLHLPTLLVQILSTCSNCRQADMEANLLCVCGMVEKGYRHYSFYFLHVRSSTIAQKAVGQLTKSHQQRLHVEKQGTRLMPCLRLIDERSGRSRKKRNFV